jgi:hypothetical protein
MDRVARGARLAVAVVELLVVIGRLFTALVGRFAVGDDTDVLELIIAALLVVYG